MTDDWQYDDADYRYECLACSKPIEPRDDITTDESEFVAHFHTWCGKPDAPRVNGEASARCSVCDGTLDDCTCDIGWDIDDTDESVIRTVEYLESRPVINHPKEPHNPPKPTFCNVWGPTSSHCCVREPGHEGVHICICGRSENGLRNRPGNAGEQ